MWRDESAIVAGDREEYAVLRGWMKKIETGITKCGIVEVKPAPRIYIQFGVQWQEEGATAFLRKVESASSRENRIALVPTLLVC